VGVLTTRQEVPFVRAWQYRQQHHHRPGFAYPCSKASFLSNLAGPRQAVSRPVGPGYRRSVPFAQEADDFGHRPRRPCSCPSQD
jgi:hypothetical protein